jgi:hypothetical protein
VKSCCLVMGITHLFRLSREIEVASSALKNMPERWGAVFGGCTMIAPAKEAQQCVKVCQRE